MAPRTSRHAATGGTRCRLGRKQRRGASASSRRSYGTPGREAHERRDHAHGSRPGGFSPDRAPRDGRPRRAPRSHLRGSRRSADRARRAPREARGRGRDRSRRGAGGRRDPDVRRPLCRARPRRARVRLGGARPSACPRDGRGRVRDRTPRRQRLGAPDQAACGGHGLMPRIDDKILRRKYHEEGDLAAREKLIEQYMSLVRSLARRYSYRGEQLEDLVQIGAIGLIKAIDRFDIERGVELTTYATPNIIGEIKRHFRDKGWSVRVPRGLQELNVQLSRLMEQLTVQLGRSPTIPELAQAAGAQEEEVLEALESGRAYSSLSLSQGSGGDGEEDLDPLESIGTEEHQYEVSEDRAVLAPGFKVLDERERMILQLRFFDGLTQSQIAQQVGISQMHVSRLIRRSLEKIRDEIAADGEEAGTSSYRA